MKTFLNQLFSLAIIFMFYQNGKAQNISASPENRGSSTISTTKVDATGVSFSNSATIGTNVLVIAVFTGKVTSGNLPAILTKLNYPDILKKGDYFGYYSH